MSQLQPFPEKRETPTNFAPLRTTPNNKKTRQGTIFLDTSHYGVEGDRLINGRLILRWCIGPDERDLTRLVAVSSSGVEWELSDIHRQQKHKSKIKR